MEAELRSVGVVDIQRNAWTYKRWRPAVWTGSAAASLTIDGRSLPVAAPGANSGATRAGGVTATLTVYDPSASPESLAGRIAVIPINVEPEVVEALANTDYEYRMPVGHYPWHDQRDEVAPARGNRLDSVSWRIFPQLAATPSALAMARESGAEAVILAFDAGSELAAGLYTFPVPRIYDLPTLIVDRDTGAELARAAAAGRQATVILEAEYVESEAYQLFGFLPGRDYGSPNDEVIKLVTHTDGPSISQDNGAFGLLALVRYFANLDQRDRRRTLMVFLDCRHYMPGQEKAFAEQDYFKRHPEALEKMKAVVGMEHLGQIEYAETGNMLKPSGRIDESLIWVTDDERLLALAIDAIGANDLQSAVVRNIARPGMNGRHQGRWYGMANPERAHGLPAVAIMGTMGAYWSRSAGLERLDPELFRRQVATFAQLVLGLMALDDL